MRLGKLDSIELDALADRIRRSDSSNERYSSCPEKQ
jgi:hypothetical protein